MVRKYLNFIKKNRNNQSNMNIAKARLLKARVMYHQNLFLAWGDYCVGGKGNFCFDFKLTAKQNSEMLWMGFTIENFKKAEQQFKLTNNKLYPWKIQYFTKTIKV